MLIGINGSANENHSKEKHTMFNLVAINLPDAHRNYAHRCHRQKCTNEGRYQIYSDIEDSGLPDWEGKPICSRHLMEEARHRPEITMSLIDMLIDALESHHLFPEDPAPVGAGTRRVIQFHPK
jgi:hypothetical protein